MSAIVFVGPTLRAEEVAGVLAGAVCMPPVAQGDVYRAAQRRPHAIGIVDGFFCGAPSVWHKEILWALSEGIHVFGSASMGALRAAELHQFGMRGVGRIFEAYRDGTLEDDDEVALLHGPAEMGYLAASEPMVNMRATLAGAVSAGALSAATRSCLERLAKEQFFQRRSWPVVLDGARASGVSAGELESFERWLSTGRIDQKREDALAMLAAMREMLARPEPFRPGFRFERTYFFEEMIVRQEDSPAERRDPSSVPHERILEELRLEGPEAYDPVSIRAAVRLLATRSASQGAARIAGDMVRAQLAGTRERLGLFTRSELETWIIGNDLDERAFLRLIEDEARTTALLAQARPLLSHCLLDELRLNGDYRRLATRARHKADYFASTGNSEKMTATQRDDVISLRMWFFSQRLRREMPDNVAGFASELGFASLADFDDALRREMLYARSQLPEGSS